MHKGLKHQILSSILLMFNQLLIETKMLFQIYVTFFNYFGIIFGFVTFTLDSTVNKCKISRKLILWNRVMTIIVLTMLISSPLYLNDVKSAEQQLKFNRITENIFSLTRLLVTLSVLVFTSLIKKRFLHLVNSALKLKSAVNLPESAYVDISKSYFNVFCLDIGVLLVIFYVTYQTRYFALNKLLIGLPNLWIIYGFKLLISSYIFMLHFAAQLVKKINKDVISLSQEKDSSSKKYNCTNLENQAMLYEEVIKFVQELHSTATFNTMMTLLGNMHDIVNFFIRIGKDNDT